jgi:hypothetical protein
VTNVVNVVNRGFEYVAQWATGNYGSAGPGAGGFTIPTVIGWGTANGSNATSTQLPATGPGGLQGVGQWMDVGPFNESAEARTTGVATVTGNSNGSGTVTAQIVGTITSSSSQSIGESFLVFSTTKPAESSVATAAGMTNSQTLMTVASNTFPAPPFYAQIDNEVILVSATAASNVFSTIVRAENASTAAIHNVNAGVSLGNIPGAAGSNPNHGDLFAHAGFIALALNNGDSIQFTWQVGVTS